MSLINSFDQVGIIHNEMLDYLININTTPTYSEFESSCVQYISEYLGNDKPIFLDAMKTMVAEIYNVEYIYSNTGYTLEEQILNDFRANGEQLKFLNRLLAPIPGSWTEYYEELQNDLLTSSMKNQEKASLLGAVSIALHSYQYWDDAKNNSANPWYQDWSPSIAVGNTARKDYLWFLCSATLTSVYMALISFTDGDVIEQGKLSYGWRAGILFAGIAGAIRSASAVFFGE